MMVDTTRVPFYKAESDRLVYCGERFADFFRCPETAVDNLDAAESLIQEMFARIAMWNALRKGEYACRCSDEERDLLDDGCC